MKATPPMMDQGGDAPDMALLMAEPASAGPNEQCVPVKALAMPDEGEQLVDPAPGDKVSYTVEGTVKRVDGGKAYVEAESINGEPVSQEEAQEPKPDDLGELESEARGMGAM